MKKELLIVNNDLDGAGCYTVYNWAADSTPELFLVTQKKAKEMIKGFFDRNPFSNFSKITVLGLDVTGFEDILDCGNIYIVSAHKGSANKEHFFKLSNFVSKEDGSTTRLLFKILKSAFKYKPTEHQKLLVVMIDDAVSRNYSLNESRDLETLFWNQKPFDRIFSFYDSFKKGFFGFNDFQKNQIVFFNKKCSTIVNNLKLFEISLPIKNKKYNFIATFADSCINEICDKIFDDYNADIVAIVNVEYNRVYFRRSKVCEVELNKLANTLCGGDGYVYAASGEITDKFVEFTKLLKPHKSQI